jgi:hypothetical protein
MEHLMTTTALTNLTQISALAVMVFAVVCEFLQNSGVTRRAVAVRAVRFASDLK